MSRIYVLAYTPGASGDFLCCQLWQQGNHWAKKSIEPFQKEFPVYYGPTHVNSYGFHNTIKYFGIEDKPLSIQLTDDIHNQIYLKDSRYGFNENTKINLLNDCDKESIWKQIENYTENQNLLSSVHFDKRQYPWRDNVKCIKLSPGPNSKKIIDAMRVVKSTTSIYKNANKIFEKYEIDDPIVQEAFNNKSIPLLAQNYFKKQGWISNWEIREFKTHGYAYDQVMPEPQTNPALWIENKLKHDINHMITDYDVEIDVDSLYEHDENELEKLFNSMDVFDVPSSTIKDIWNYFDVNVKLFDSWTGLGNGDWKQYLSDFILENIKKGSWARTPAFYLPTHLRPKELR